MTSSAGRPAAVPRLTRDQVLRAALGYVDANGLAALSIRKLGAELGVPGMSLYSYVDSKDALLDGIVEAMAAELEMPPAEGMAWPGALRKFARSLRDMIHRHPAAAPLLASRQFQPVQLLEVVGGYLRLLRRAGFSEERALEVMRSVHAYAQGHTLTEVSWGLVEDLAAPDDLARLRWVTGVVPRDTPDRVLRIAMGYCCPYDVNRQFEVGLDLMIQGLQAERGESAGRHQPPG